MKAEAYREALKQTPNGFYRRQLYVLEVNLRQQQAMWVDLHHSIFYEVSHPCLLCPSPCLFCHHSCFLTSSWTSLLSFCTATHNPELTLFVVFLHSAIRETGVAGTCRSLSGIAQIHAEHACSWVMSFAICLELCML